MAQNPESIRRLLRQLEQTELDEISCDECFELLDVFAEVAYTSDDADRLLPMVRKHLDLCQDCREEFEALMAALKGSRSP